MLIRQLSDRIINRLKNRAKEHGRSLQAEQAWKRIDILRHKLKRSGKTFSDSADLIREDRNR